MHYFSAGRFASCVLRSLLIIVFFLKVWSIFFSAKTNSTSPNFPKMSTWKSRSTVSTWNIATTSGNSWRKQAGMEIIEYCILLAAFNLLGHLIRKLFFNFNNNSTISDQKHHEEKHDFQNSKKIIWFFNTRVCKDKTLLNS